MPETETILLGGQPHEIEVRPITLIVPGPEVTQKFEYPKRIPIDMEACLYHLERVKVFDPEVPELFRHVFPEYTGEVTPEIIWRREGMGAKHVAGRLDLTLKLMKQNIPIVWQYPEACVHPSAQLELMDVIIKLIKRFQYQDMTTDTLVDEVFKDGKS